MKTYICLIACLVILGLAGLGTAGDTPKLSEERVVLQLQQGDIEFAFFPEVAPVTTAHIFKLVQLGLYTTNQFFRVDKGFVAQVSDVTSGRLIPLNEQQKLHASKNVPLEVKPDVKHHAGVLSMGRYDDPNSGTSSFSILLGDAPHLDMTYTIFGMVTKGMEVLRKLEEVPTKREGIFVMPVDRITIQNSYWYRVGRETRLVLDNSKAGQLCEEELSDLKQRFLSQEEEIQMMRKKMLP